MADFLIGNLPHVITDMQNKLSFKIKTAYGAGSFLEAGFYNFATSYFLLYLSSVALLSPELAGLVCSGAVLFEALGGILAGRISDRFTGKNGRRRPFMITSSFFLLLLFNGIFIDYGGNDFLRAIIYFCLISLFWLFYSVFYVPYIALGAEICSDYEERTSLRTYARFFAILGNLLCTVATFLMVGKLTDWGLSTQTAWKLYAFIISAVCCFTGVYSWKMTAGLEPETHSLPKETEKEPFWEVLKDYFDLMKLKSFFLVITSRSLFILAYTFYTSSMTYFVKYNLNLSDAGASSTFLVGIAASLISMPVISWLAKIIGKQQQIIASLLISAAGSILLYVTGIDTYSKVLLYVCLFTFAHSNCWQLFYSIFYDISEVDEFVNGKRREGSISSLISVLGTIMVSVGIWITGILLDAAGYNASLAQQTSHTLQAIEMTFVLLPSLCLLLAAIVLKLYPMTKERFDILKQAIQAKNAGEDLNPLLPKIRCLFWKHELKKK